MENRNEKIAILLKRLGISPSLIGYKYIAEAIEIVLDDENAIYKITKVLYPTIAKKHDSKPSNVERSIRHAIEYGMVRLDDDLRLAVFGNLVSKGCCGIANGEFIGSCVQLIKSEPNNKIWHLEEEI